MSWIEKLCETYDNCEQYVGIEENGCTLMPISHTSQNSQIECYINDDLELYQAVVINKEDAPTMVPCTIASANRTSGPVAHPLFDKLSYMAKDFDTYYDKKGNFHLYESQLMQWCEQGVPEELHILLRYLQKGTLISDLIQKRILFINDDGKLMDKWTGSSEDKPEIFKVVGGVQSAAVLRFRIRSGNDIAQPIWKLKEVQDSFLKFYIPKLTKRDICIVSGTSEPITEVNPAYLRYPGDQAKLLSTNDTVNFTYRGRFEDGLQAMSIGYISSQKAHNALKWLIARQGARFGEMVILAWGTRSVQVLSPTIDTPELFMAGGVEELPSTYQDYALALRDAMHGYGNKRFANAKEQIVVLGMDSATPGRLSLIFYQELASSDFLNRIVKWHTTCSWKNQMRFIKDTQNIGKFKKQFYFGAPSPYTIIKGAYGDRVKDKMVKSTMKQLLACILDGMPMPKDIMQNIAERYSKPQGRNTYEDRELLYVACAVIRKYLNDQSKFQNQKEEWHMDLDLENKDVNYLWGRLLAYAYQLESRANYVSKEERETNAVRYRKQFQMFPQKTWFKIYDNLDPYRKKLMKVKQGNELHFYESGMAHIMKLLEELNLPEKPLEAKWILGYGAQLDELWSNKKVGKENESEEKHDDIISE